MKKYFVARITYKQNKSFQVHIKFGDTLAIRKPNQYSLNYSCQSGQIEEIGDSKNWLFSANKKDDKIYEFHYELKKLSAKITFDCKMYPHKEMLVS